MKTALIVVHGWLGDALFASSVAERLIREQQFNAVDYLLGFPQTAPILQCNPFINRVYISSTLGPSPDYSDYASAYDAVFVLPVNDLVEPPTIKYQKACGVRQPTLPFRLQVAIGVEREFVALHAPVIFNGRKNIGICQVWKRHDESFFNTTELESQLATRYNVFPIGSRIGQFDGAQHVSSYVLSAVAAKYMDYVVGAEGGLTNLASGMGTKVIYTTDFTYALFGPQGRHRQYSDPLTRIGPCAFFPSQGHVPLQVDVNYANLFDIITQIVQ